VLGPLWTERNWGLVAVLTDGRLANGPNGLDEPILVRRIAGAWRDRVDAQLGPDGASDRHDGTLGCGSARGWHDRVRGHGSARDGHDRVHGRGRASDWHDGALAIPRVAGHVVAGE
jgi:hypothetical protein